MPQLTDRVDSKLTSACRERRLKERRDRLATCVTTKSILTLFGVHTFFYLSAPTR